MPTYQYECSSCQHAFEQLQSIADPKLKKCPKCSKKTLHRLIGAGSGVIFKGSGFYATDYKKKEIKNESPSPSSGCGCGAGGHSCKKG